MLSAGRRGGVFWHPRRVELCKSLSAGISRISVRRDSTSRSIGIILAGPLLVLVEKRAILVRMKMSASQC